MGNNSYSIPSTPSLSLSDFLSKKTKKILVIGSIGYDQKIFMEEMPKIGETKTGNIEINFGGKGNIQAVACGRSDEDTIFLGAVGDKDYIIFQKHLDDNNVFPVLKTVKNITSHTASILIEKNCKNRIIIDPRASYYVDRNLIDTNEQLFDKSNYILLQLEINFETVEYIIDKYKDKKIIILRPSPVPVKELERLKQLIKQVDYLILNEVELAKISGKTTNSPEEIEVACENIKNGLKNLIVPLLDKGWLLYDENGKKTKFSPYSVGPIKDYVGVMDCFIGVFTSFLCKNYKPNEAIKYAILAANICSTIEGTIPSIPTFHEIIKRKNNIEQW